MQVNPDRRLGSGPLGADEIKTQSWFADFDWQDMEQRKMQAPFLPPSATSNMQESMSFAPISSSQDGPEEESRNRRDVFAEEWDDVWEWIDDQGTMA